MDGRRASAGAGSSCRPRPPAVRPRPPAGTARTPATASAGTTPSGGSGSSDLPEPAPVTSTDYDGEVGGPHQDTPEERTGAAVPTGRLVFIAAVVAVTAGIVLTLVLRGRRRRDAAGPR